MRSHAVSELDRGGPRPSAPAGPGPPERDRRQHQPHQLGRYDRPLDATLRLIVESAIEIVPGASAVLYTYDADAPGLGSRLARRGRAARRPDCRIGRRPAPTASAHARIRQRRPVLSYEEPDLDIHPTKRAAGARPSSSASRWWSPTSPSAPCMSICTKTAASAELELLLLDNFVNQAAMAHLPRRADSTIAAQPGTQGGRARAAAPRRPADLLALQPGRHAAAPSCRWRWK